MTKDKESSEKVMLVIEDDIPLLEAIEMKLGKEGFKVISSRSVERAFGLNIEDMDSNKVTVDSIQRALKFIETLEQVDAIWLDHNLIGKENGLDFVEKFKSNGGRWTKIPIFVISNTSDVELQKAYEEVGVKDYFIKAEHKLADIVEKIKKALNMK